MTCYAINNEEATLQSKDEAQEILTTVEVATKATA